MIENGPVKCPDCKINFEPQKTDEYTVYKKRPILIKTKDKEKKIWKCPYCDHKWTDNEPRFAFGKNWKKYSNKVDLSHIYEAIAGLYKLIKYYQDPWYQEQERSFLDIGCGSGIHSIAASQLGFKRIIVVDYDPISVEITIDMLNKFLDNESLIHSERTAIKVFEDDILSSSIDGEFDVVYSWGVLHHTGNLNQAIQNAKEFTKQGGLFIIAIYVKTRFCGMWRKIKRFYCKSPKLMQKIMAVCFYSVIRFRQLFNGKFFKDYKANRGMNLFCDTINWLGGYPYESASPNEVIQMVGSEFKLIDSYIPAPSRGLFGTGCAEYVFQRSK